MELQQQIFDYSEVTGDPRCSPQTARLPDFNQAVSSMAPYSPHVIFYPPPPPPPPEAAYGLPQPQPPQPQAEPYYYYFPAAGHASRQSPDSLSAKLSPPPAGLPMPQPTPLCYGPYPPCCCCAQLHYQHQHQHMQPRCSPDHLLFPRQQLPAAPVTEFIPPLVPTLQGPPPPPQPLQPRQAAPMRKAARAVVEQGNRSVRGGESASRRRPSGMTEPPVSGTGSWILHDLQQRRRSGYMHNILYKTELCRDMQDRGACPRGRACQFAHSPGELQDPRRHPLYKTAFCFDYKNKGHCPRGERCFHVHEITELRESSAPLPHLSSPSSNGPSRAGGSGGRGGTYRHRRSPAAGGVSMGPPGGSQKPQDALEPGASTANGGSGRRAGKDAKSATTETSYRYLMKKLSSSKASPSSAGRRGSAVSSGTDAGPAGTDLLASLETKTRRLCLGPDDGEQRILECVQCGAN